MYSARNKKSCQLIKRFNLFHSWTTLQSLYPNHHRYEQYGDLEGVIKIDGKQYSLQSSGLCDINFGKKNDWHQYQNYVLHFIRLSNGNSISVGVASVGVVSVPVLFRRYYYTNIFFFMQLTIQSSTSG